MHNTTTIAVVIEFRPDITYINLIRAECENIMEKISTIKNRTSITWKSQIKD